jgi:hypothetical protein
VPYLKLGWLFDEYSEQRSYELPAPEIRRRDFGKEAEPLSRLGGNAIIATRRGYRGFVSGELKINDLVFVAYGANYPYVLCPTGVHQTESYNWIGNRLIVELIMREVLDLNKEGD